MRIQWDAWMLCRIADELNQALAKRVLRGFYLDRDGFALFLYFRDCLALVRLHPDEGGILVEEELQAADALPDGTHRYPGRLLRVEAPVDDRKLTLRFIPHRGKRGPLDLHIDWIPNRRNVFVVETSSERVQAVLREGVGPGPGDRWEAPGAKPRDGADTPLERLEWRALWSAGAVEELRRRVLASVAYTSKLNIDAILGASPTDGERTDASDAAYDRYRAVVHTDPNPGVVEVGGRRFPYPNPLPGADHIPHPRLLDAIGALLGSGDATVTTVPSTLIEGLERAARHTRRREESLRREWGRIRDPEAIRAEGHLLLAYLHEVRRGASEVTLTGFDGTPVRLELDPRKTPQENAEDRFADAQKAERARNSLPDLMEKMRKEGDRIAELLERVRTGAATPEELDLAARFGTGEAARIRSQPAALPYRSYRTKAGTEVRVGRGSRSNDALTFQHSRPDDIWMHARHAAGAHVILRWDREDNPPERELYEAGVLAAVHSKARHSGSVPVDWTRRKYVRKPRKAPAGAVVPDRVKTVFVEPDADYAESMRVTDEAPASEDA